MSRAGPLAHSRPSRFTMRILPTVLISCLTLATMAFPARAGDKSALYKSINSRDARCWEAALRIWEWAEPGYQEKKSSALLAKMLYEVLSLHEAISPAGISATSLLAKAIMSGEASLLAIDIAVKAQIDRLGHHLTEADRLVFAINYQSQVATLGSYAATEHATLTGQGNFLF
jgi:hypothetical protein